MNNKYNSLNGDDNEDDEDDQSKALFVVYFNTIKLQIDGTEKEKLKRKKERENKLKGNNDDKPSIIKFDVYNNIFDQMGMSRMALLFWYFILRRPKGNEIENLPRIVSYNERNYHIGPGDKELVKSTSLEIVVKNCNLSETYEIDVIASADGLKTEVRYSYSLLPVEDKPNVLNGNIKINNRDVKSEKNHFSRNRENGRDYQGSESYHENLKGECFADLKARFLHQFSIQITVNETFNLDLNVDSISQHENRRNDVSYEKTCGNSIYNDGIIDVKSKHNHEISASAPHIQNVRSSNFEQNNGVRDYSRNRYDLHPILDQNFDNALNNQGKFYRHSSVNSEHSQGNPDLINPYFEHNFDSFEFYDDAQEMADKRSGFETFSMFGILLKSIAVIIEEYCEYSTKGIKLSNYEGKTKFRLVIVPSEIFEEAMRRCHIDIVELAYSYIFPSDCRMFVGVPVYRHGYIHRKDQL